MQDLLIQAQLPEPVPAAVRTTTQQEQAVTETSFDDVLEARLDDRERKKSQQNQDQDHLAAASAAQPVVQGLHTDPQEKAGAGVDGQQMEASLSTRIGAVGQEKAAAAPVDAMQSPAVKTVAVDAADSQAAGAPAEARGFIPDAGFAPGVDLIPEQNSNAETTSSPAPEVIQGETNQGSTSMKGDGIVIENQAQPPEHIKSGIGKFAGETPVETPLSALPEQANSIETAVQEAVDTAVQSEETTSEGTAVQVSRRSGGDNPNSASQYSGIQAPMEGAAAQRTTGIEPARTAEAQQAAFLPQVEESISSMVKSRQTAMQIQLHPEDLGRIQIRLVQDDQGLRVAMRAEQQDTSRLLEQNLQALQKSLADAGIQLSGFDIGSRSQQNFGQTPDSWQMHSSGQPEFHSARSMQEPERTAVSYGVDSAVDYRI